MSIVSTINSDTLRFYIELIVRLIISCVLGGIIGYEREHTRRPAGFRTHILVCVGSALIMITAEYIFRQYRGQVAIDPTRMGAQVISGIGFLGAGTIIRQGASVKGLTTAASLWAVSCIGIAAGTGFYGGAVAATLFIYLTLILLKRAEIRIKTKSIYRNIFIDSKNIPGRIAEISSVLDNNGITLKSIEFVKNEDSDTSVFKLLVKIPDNDTKATMLEELHLLTGIVKIYEE